MNILLTLDYEIFFGDNTGSIDQCLIVPMGYLLNSVKPFDVKFTIFVDATYLYRLYELSREYKVLNQEYQKLISHLLFLREEGHDLQLHIHPHWHFSSFDGEKWLLDRGHYKLCDLSIQEAEHVFRTSKNHLDTVLGYKTCAFRAGGFSTQPTHLFEKLFISNNIHIDSSVCPGQSYNSSQQTYNYLNAPSEDSYLFQKDINVADPKGIFVEVPISMCKVSPWFYWKYVVTRLFRVPSMRMWGDGQSIKATNESIWNRLSHDTLSMATIDGFKISMLEAAYQQISQKGKNVFCVIGHPKLANPYSVNKLAEFCKKHNDNGDNFITISELRHE